MKRYFYCIVCCSFFIFQNVLAQNSENTIKKKHVTLDSSQTLTRIAFGSCANQNKPQLIWAPIVKFSPDLFIFLGDNVYGDTKDMNLLKAKYSQLGKKEGYQKLQKLCPIIATWDDHDYGLNDSGLEYSKKEESKQIFLDFFQEPLDSPRRKRPGIYTSYYFGFAETRVQILLLDSRYFRTPWDKVSKEQEVQRRKLNMGKYRPTQDISKTILGEEQWLWLEKELCKPAKLRIICSSLQIVPEFNGWEAWANMPHERERLFHMIAKHKVQGVIFISGDTHWAEFSSLQKKGCYPFHEITSSGLTEVWSEKSPNKNRVGNAYFGQNFGTVEIDWQQDPIICLQVYSLQGKAVISKTIRLSELEFPKLSTE